mmetsp:Transcript_11367/g.30922  ORF Transcript_11367/g.30922 Transcript_11367/m.30922 type:complete len:211 (+) Transcript_11367:503-1135(+)
MTHTRIHDSHVAAPGEVCTPSSLEHKPTDRFKYRWLVLEPVYKRCGPNPMQPPSAPLGRAQVLGVCVNYCSGLPWRKALQTFIGIARYPVLLGNIVGRAGVVRLQPLVQICSCCTRAVCDWHHNRHQKPALIKSGPNDCCRQMIQTPSPGALLGTLHELDEVNSRPKPPGLTRQCNCWHQALSCRERRWPQWHVAQTLHYISTRWTATSR